MKSWCVVCFLMLASASVALGETVDLSKAILVVDTGQKTLAKAAAMIQDDVAKRAGLSLAIASAAPANAPAIVLAVSDNGTTSNNPEAYSVAVDPSTGTVRLSGRSPRAVLFAAGFLLRKATVEKGVFTCDSALRADTAPVYPVRAHQLGYRETANAYDAWSVSEYEQYIRDLVLFGANGIELIPTLDPDEAKTFHMELSQWDMTLAVSKLMDDYDLDVWLWLALDGDVTDDAIAKHELEARRKLFDACVRIDDIFVPGGDPGDTEPDVLMPWLARMSEVLHEKHPDAGIWVSNQGFTAEQNDDFFAYIERERPKWLSGVVFGPWVKITVKEMRERTPAEYPIRLYPDITHNVRCQYPVPEWAPAFAHTLGREACNPRPAAQQRIHNLIAPFSVGFGTYSDGINDDVNKMVWSALGWNPDANVDEVLADYGRVFFGAQWADDVAAGLRGLEQDWVGPVLENAAIDTTFATWQGIEKEMGVAAINSNWRMQMHLLRAYYDAYVKARRAEARDAEQAAMDLLAGADATTVAKAISDAQDALQPQRLPETTAALRTRIEAMGSLLFKTIGMQLDVKRYNARNPERGAVLEFLDFSFNNSIWLNAELARVAEIARDDNAKALAEALAIVHWEDPAPGALYDDLGHVGKQPHLVRQLAWEEDPGAVQSPQEEFSKPNEQPARLSWLDQSQTLFGTPLRLHYDGLDGKRQYRLRVTYNGRFRATMTLHADDSFEIHGPVKQPSPIAPQEYDVPREATADGALDLEWRLVDGRGCQVAEVWLIPAP